MRRRPHGQVNLRDRQGLSQVQAAAYADPPHQGDADHHAQVADADDDEGLGGGLPRPRPTDGDHPEQGQQQALPEEQQHHQVVGQHRAVQHGHGDQQVAVELVQMLPVAHELPGVQHRQERKGARRQEDERAEGVQPQRELQAKARPRNGVPDLLRAGARLDGPEQDDGQGQVSPALSASPGRRGPISGDPGPGRPARAAARGRTIGSRSTV